MDKVNIKNLYRLYRIQCEDLLCLAEMEYNGMLFEKQKAMEKAKDITKQLEEIEYKFKDIVGSVPVSITSDAQLSCVFYGGTIKEKLWIPIGVYKSGKKKGQVRNKIVCEEYILPRLTNPIPKTETASSIKKRMKGESEHPSEWSVGEDVLLKLKGVKKLVNIVLEYRRLDTLRGTFLEGWSNLIDMKCWEDNYIHSNLNQCIAETGRLSSTSPNVQNSDKETKKFLVSRYDS